MYENSTFTYNPETQNFEISSRELILNQQYLPHLNSDSADFFFEFGYLFPRNPNLQFVYENFAHKFSELLCKLLAQKTILLSYHVEKPIDSQVHVIY